MRAPRMLAELAVDLTKKFAGERALRCRRVNLTATAMRAAVESMMKRSFGPGPGPLERSSLNTMVRIICIKRLRSRFVCELSEADRLQTNYCCRMCEGLRFGGAQAISILGARKLKARLERMNPFVVWPAASTIGEILRRSGLTNPVRKRRRTTPYSQPFSEVTDSGYSWRLRSLLPGTRLERSRVAADACACS